MSDALLALIGKKFCEDIISSIDNLFHQSLRDYDCDDEALEGLLMRIKMECVNRLVEYKNYEGLTDDIANRVWE